MASEHLPDTGRRLVYEPSLDGLRAVAILMVVAYHDRLLRGGFLGVQLFFVLSGYLITSLLQREQEAEGALRLARFYGRRFLRLAPALCLFVTVAWLVTHGLSPSLSGWLKGSWALAALLYVSNLVIAFGREYPLGLVSICWSLALEEQFYLLWPAGLRLLHRVRAGWRGIAGLLAGLIVACLALRYLLLARGGGDPTLWLRVYFGPDTSAEGLLWGCLLAMLADRVGRRPAPALAAALGLAGAGALGAMAARVDIVHLVESPLLLTLAACASALLIVAALSPGVPRRLLELRPLVWLGQLSYSLYLWHAFSIDLLVHEPRWRRYALMLGLACASHYLVERPVLDLARRWGALRRPHPWSWRLAAPVLGMAGLVVATALGSTRLLGWTWPGLDLHPLVRARERLADGQPGAAVEPLRRAALLEPREGGIRAELGTALLRARRGEEAAAAFREALALDPGLADAHLGLGTLAMDQGRLGEAVGHLAAAARLRPADAGIRNELGVALALSRRYEEAAAQFQAALQLGGGASVQENLARALQDRARAGAAPPR
jgi:peptidoglycan/LPS O-acetylase OafA/YrhL